MLLIGGGSGMSPLWSILSDHIASGEQRPIRFFYGARTPADLFYLTNWPPSPNGFPTSSSFPALSHADAKATIGDGETGFVHEVVRAI